MMTGINANNLLIINLIIISSYPFSFLNLEHPDLP